MPKKTLEIMSGTELLNADLPAPRWAVPGVVPHGLSLLVGKSKVGKSYLSLDMSVAVAKGGYLLGDIKVEQGPVLYACFEGGAWLFQKRLRERLQGEPWLLDSLSISTNSVTHEEGLLEEVAKWAAKQVEPRLIIIDTLGKVKPPHKRGSDLYAEDVKFMTAYQDFALNAGLALVFVHHENKAERIDDLDSVGGTTGIAGTADVTLLLKRPGRSNVGTLLGRGRSIPDTDIPVLFRDGVWVKDPSKQQGQQEESKTSLTPDQEAIVRYLGEKLLGATGLDISNGVHKDLSNTLKRLKRLIELGIVMKDGELYHLRLVM